MASEWMKRAAASAAIAAILSALPGAAYAASCASLRSQIAAASSSRPDAARAARFEQAARRQRSELAATKRMAARARCTGRSTAECSTLNSTIYAMDVRIAELDAQAKRARGNRSVATLKRQLDRQGCNAAKSRSPRKATKPISRPASKAKTAQTRRTSISTPSAPAAPIGGNYRTVCVRTCDGYFFPVSNAVAPQSFPTDVKRCAAMCPRAETKLFVHGLSGDAQTMFDRNGKRYSAQSYAFRHTRPDYRPSPSCTCGRPLAPRPVAELRGSTARQPVPAPLDMGPPALDAETRRNASVDFGWGKASDIIAARTTERPERAVRVVGPVFLPDPEAATTR